MDGIFGRHIIENGLAEGFDAEIGDNKLVILPAGEKAFSYRRSDKRSSMLSECILASDKKTVAVGVFPSPPLHTPKRIASMVYLKFKTPLIVAQKTDATFYTKMPMEIAVYSQSEDEEMMIDAFSLKRPRYAMYGPAERGFLCRYYEVDIAAAKDEVKPEKFSEALLAIQIRNGIDNVIKISKVIVPLDNVILDHAGDNAWLPGTVEVSLDQRFGKDVVNVRLVDSKVKRSDKTSDVQKMDSLTFSMDSGY